MSNTPLNALAVPGRVVLDAAMLRRLRQQHGLSQDDLADACYERRVRVSASSIKRAETGHPVLFRIARELARYFDVSVTSLVRNALNDEQAPARPVETPSRTVPAGDPPSPALVGRRREQARFDVALRHHVLAGRGFVLQMRGEPGIGKSRLLDHFVRTAQAAGMTTVVLPVQQQDGRAWHQPLAGLLCTLLDLRNSTDHLVEALGARARELGLSDTEQMHLCCFLGGTLPEHWLRAYEAMDFTVRRAGENAILLKLLARFPHPLLIAVEDVQWADVNLVLLLKQVAAGIVDLPVLLVLTSRPDDGTTAEVWGSGIMNTPCVALELAPLDPEEAKALADGFAHLPAAFRDTCVRLAEGNPLFLEQLLLNFEGLPARLPRSMEAHVLGKLSRLNPSDRLALEAASVIGDSFGLDEVRDIIGDAGWQADGLVAQHLILDSGNGAHYAFCHALIRQSVYASLSGPEQQRLHSCAAALFQGCSPTLQAHHLAAAQRLSASQAYLDAAESMYEQCNYVDALTLVDNALGLAVTDQYRCEMVRLKAALLKLLALPEKSVIYLLEAADLASSDAQRSWAWCELADTYLGLLRPVEALRALERAEQHASSAPGSARQHARIAMLRQALAGGAEAGGETKLPRIADTADLLEGVCSSLRDLSSRPEQQGGASAGRVLRPGQEVRVGVVHSQTGFLRELEAGVLRATLLAFDEINNNGGVLGRRIVPTVVDGRSSETVFMEQAARLVARDDIATIFGCSTSSSRRRVKPLIEDNDHLLIYPFQYEGIEASPHIAYVGPAPTQQALPAVDWLVGQGRRRFMLVGSDYVYPVVTNEVIKARIASMGGAVVAEHYIPLGGRDFRAAIDDVRAHAPDAIILSIVGFDSNHAFLQQLRRAGHVAPTLLSLVLSEDDLASIPADCTAGIYSVFSYFQNIDHPLNQDFVRRYRQRFGERCRISGYMESAYVGAYLWAKSVQRAESLDRSAIRAAMKGISHFGPGGVAYMDEENNHVWRHVRVAQVGRDGQYHVAWTSPRPVRPEPYPLCKTEQEWHAYLRALRQRWRGRWESPAAAH